MRHLLLIIVSTVILLLISASAASAFGWKDVLQMHKDGIDDKLIIQKIEYSGKTFRLDADDMRKLKEKGVSDKVISAMLRTEAREYDDYDRDYDYGYYYHHYPRTRLYVGFGGYYPYYGYYSRYWYPRHYSSYPRSYRTYRHGGQYGDTRYRGQVGERLYGGNRGPAAGFRERSRPANPGAGARTRTR